MSSTGSEELSTRELVKRRKQELRKKAKDLFTVLNKNQKSLQERSEKTVLKIVAMPEFQKARRVLLYSPLPGEVDIRSVSRLPHRDLGEPKTWVLPRAIGDSRILLFEFADFETLQEEKYGIKVPKATNRLVPLESIDFVVVPGMMFTRKGARLGRGGGYYDRLISECADHTSCVGLCFEELLAEDLPLEEHDSVLSKVLVA